MALTLYNSLTRRKEEFRPLDPENVRMYVCGPTVYDFAHIGNARAVVVFDLLYRVLRHEYGEAHVKYVRNITDVEDKIIDAARTNNEPIDALTARTEQIFQDDMDALGNLRPDVQPRATAHIPQMIAMIEKLIAGGHAYAAEGHALFAVGSWPGYGKLSRRSRKEMIAGARVEVAPYKKDPGDFVLWKPSTPDQPGWDSPWGRGRPGWHIECSAMSEAHLGESFDIHGGGIDLIFPHHENEIAQSEAAHGGKKFVNFWVHNGFLSVDSTKMSKSLGNFVTAHDVLSEWPGEVVRLALLSTHYRDPLDWTERRLQEAWQITIDLYLALAMAPEEESSDRRAPPAAVLRALEDDLNTHVAIQHLRVLRNRLVHSSPGKTRGALRQELVEGAHLIGLLQYDADPLAHVEAIKALHRGGIHIEVSNYIRARMDGRNNDAARIEESLSQRGIVLKDSGGGAVAFESRRIDELVAARALAREERRFSDADRIRSDLATEGVILEDSPSGTTWRLG